MLNVKHLPLKFSVAIIHSYLLYDKLIFAVDLVVDVEGNACHGPIVKLPFASLFDTLGM